MFHTYSSAGAFALLARNLPPSTMERFTCSGHGNGNSWHEADKLAHVPDWIKDGAQVYSATGWRAGQPFTISNAAAKVVTLTTPDGFKFHADIVEVLTKFSRTA